MATKSSLNPEGRDKKIKLNYACRKCVWKNREKKGENIKEDKNKCYRTKIMVAKWAEKKSK